MSNLLQYPSHTPLQLDPAAATTNLAADPGISPLRWFLVEVVNAANTEENLNRWSSFIGICIAIAGNVLISLALNVQKYAHTRLEREAERRRESGRRRGIGGAAATESEEPGEAPGLRELHGIEEVEEGGRGGEEEPLLGGVANGRSHRSEKVDGDGGDTSYIASPYWWLGLVMMSFGECGNFLAYGFAPASIVSPLGVVALISNCVIAPVMLKESFRVRDILGILVSVAGAVVVVWSAEKEETKLGPDEILKAISQTAFEVYFGVTCGLILLLMQFSRRYGHRTIVIDLGLVALFGGYTVLSTKGISSLISSSFYHIFQYPIAYLFTFVLVSTAVLQVKYVNRALQRFDSTQVIPTQFVLFTLSVIMGSAILYRDFERVTKERMLKFVTGCVLTFAGVYLISSKRKSSSAASSSSASIASEENGEFTPTPRASPAEAERPVFARGLSSVSSNAVSFRSASDGNVAASLQNAAADPLFPPPNTTSMPKRRATEQFENFLAAGSNLMTGYQLQSVIAERVGGSLKRAASRDGLGGTALGEGSARRGRRSSLSLVMEFMKGKGRSKSAGRDRGEGSDGDGE
jgi:drug/metabolite transporter (DMT)-like permease